MQPGVYRGISNDAYHGGPGHSKSGLDLIRKSPAHLLAVRTPDEDDSEDDHEATASQKLGAAFHALVLEPEVFAATYALPFEAPAGALKTIEDLQIALEKAEIKFKKSARKTELESLAREHIPGVVLLSDALAAWEAKNEGREILAPEVWKQIHRMRDAVMADPTARKLLSAPGEAELSAYWYEPVINPQTGEHIEDEDGKPVYTFMRCRPDKWRYDGILIDLKSTHPGGASPEEFSRHVLNWRYYVQDPLYMRGARSALEHMPPGSGFDHFLPPRAFVFIAVETDARVIAGIPKGVSVHQIQPDSVALGEAEIREDIFTLHQCETSGRWPGYPSGILPLELPPYAFTKAAARMGAAA